MLSSWETFCADTLSWLLTRSLLNNHIIYIGLIICNYIFTALTLLIAVIYLAYKHITTTTSSSYWKLALL